MSRIAIVDLLFNWPPDGGARMDVKEIALRLSREHEVCIFVPDFSYYNFPRGKIRDKLPFNVQKIPLNPREFFRFHICYWFKREINKYKPDFVFITDGWYLKPYLVNTLKQYKPILRFYAYETLCIKSHGHFYRDGRICNEDYLNGSLECITNCIGCSLRWLKDIGDEKFIHEFRISFVFCPFYRNLVKRAIKNAGKIIVYNEFIKNKIIKFNKNVIVAPSGIDIQLFKPKKKPQSKEAKILMVGRAEDEVKGFSTLYEACKILRREKYDFQLLLTTKDKDKEDYITSVGWLTQEALAQLYQQVDICVVPSLWPEPFGIVVLEAMASGKPVIVTKVGGLQTVLEDGKEGFIIEPNDVNGLVQRLTELLMNPELREQMGQAGRKKVEERYDWDKIYEKYYSGLFNRQEELSYVGSQDE